MVRLFIFLVIILLSQHVTAQKKSSWPFIKNPVPRYLAAAGGYEGLKTHNYQAGLMVNLLKLEASSPIGGLVGGGLFYKQNMNTKLVRSYEAEIGMYCGLVLGLNYNYNITGTGTVQGFKPFAGIAVYNFQLFYGYCFYRTADDRHGELRHNRITLRYVLPVIKLQKN